MKSRLFAGRCGATALLVILLFACAFRFAGIGEKSLWLDEVMSVRLAQMGSVSAVVREVASYDVHPPLYPVLHHFWMAPGGGDGFSRMPSAFFGVGAVLAMYPLARRLLGERAALLAAGLLAISPFHVHYSQEARNYALIILLGLVLTWLLVVIVQSREQAPWWAWAAYGFVGAACLYTFVMSVLLIVAHGVVFLLVGRRSLRNLLAGLGAGGFVGTSFLPWFPVLRRRMETIEEIAERQGAQPAPRAGDLLGALREWMLAPEFVLRGGGRMHVGLGVACLLIVGLAVWRTARFREPGVPPGHRWEALITILGLLVLPVFGYLLLPTKRVHPFDPKHLAFVQPICLLAVAALAGPVRPVSEPKVRWGDFGGPGGVLILVLAAFNLAALGFYYRPTLQKARWPEAAAYIASRGEADYILANPSRGVPYALERYYSGGMEIVAPHLGAAMPPGARMKREFNRVWLVACRNEVVRPTKGLIAWFREHTRLVDEGAFAGAPGRIIYCGLYERTPDTPVQQEGN